MTNTYQLFFGRNIPNGGVVTDEEWNAFMTEIIDTLFDGYTVQDVDGVWKGQHEQTKLVTVCTDNYDDVMILVNHYKRIFNQESVAIQTMPAMVFA